MEPVTRRQARFELMPNGEQKRKMRRFGGSARYVSNLALAFQNKEREKTCRKRSGYAALCRMLTAWRNDPQTVWRGLALSRPFTTETMSPQSVQIMTHSSVPWNANSTPPRFIRRFGRA